MFRALAGFVVKYQTVHRAALQSALVQGAEKSGVVKLHLGHFITEYDFDNTRFKVKGKEASGEEWITGDVLIAADGVKSKARAAMMQRNGEVDEGQCEGLHLCDGWLMI